MLFLWGAGGAAGCFLLDRGMLILAGFIAFSELRGACGCLAAARFARDCLGILSFDTEGLSPPAVFELGTWNLAVVLFNSFLTACCSRIFGLGPRF